MDANQITDHMDKFKLKVIASERSVSQLKPDGSGNNPMNVVDLEFIDNPLVKTKNADGEFETVDVNGLQVRTWVTLVPQAINSVNTFRKFIGLEPTTVEALPSEDGNLYLGKVGEAIVKFSGRPMKNSAGEAIINSYTGKPVLVGERKIVKMLTP